MKIKIGNQCEIITTKGEQCKRNAVYWIKHSSRGVSVENYVCSHHYRMAKGKQKGKIMKSVKNPHNSG